MERSSTALLALLAAALLAGPARGAPPGALLPVQDRAGDPEALAVFELELRRRLGAERALADVDAIRESMRRARLRDPGASAPSRLDRLIRSVGADWYFLATLHEVDRGEVPLVTVSGRVVRAGGGIEWAGFESASGLDWMGPLGIGRIDALEPLIARVTGRLVDDFLGRPPRRKRVRAAAGGFRRGPLGEPGVVAVIPFDAVVGRDPTGAAETVSNLALAVLHRRGVPLADPAAVEELLRRRGVTIRGELDRLSRAALRAAVGAELFLTGTVERYESSGSLERPEPHVAVSARLLGAEDGRILWLAGVERSGGDSEKLFGTGRFHAAGALAERVLHSLVAGWLGPPRRPEVPR